MPLQEVECDFTYAGCEVKLPRMDMPNHLKENFDHVTLLAQQNQVLTQQNQKLMEKLLEKYEQIKRMMEEHQKDADIAKLKKQVVDLQQ